MQDGAPAHHRLAVLNNRFPDGWIIIIIYKCHLQKNEDCTGVVTKQKVS